MHFCGTIRERFGPEFCGTSWYQGCEFAAAADEYYRVLTEFNHLVNYSTGHTPQASYSPQNLHEPSVVVPCGADNIKRYHHHHQRLNFDVAQEHANSESVSPTVVFGTGR